MPSKLEDAFAWVKQLVADFRANGKFYLSPAYQEGRQLSGEGPASRAREEV